MLNPYLVRDLKAARAVERRELADQLKYFDGDLEQIEACRGSCKERYRTAFQIDRGG